jgi:hypothetical protein
VNLYKRLAQGTLACTSAGKQSQNTTFELLASSQNTAPYAAVTGNPFLLTAGGLISVRVLSVPPRIVTALVSCPTTPSHLGGALQL